MDARLGGSGLLCAARSALPSYDHRNTQELAVQNIPNSILSLWRSPKLYRDPIDSSQRSAASQRFLRVFRRSDRPIPPANACGLAASRHRSCNASGPKLFAGGGHPSSLARNACISASLCALATPDATMLRSDRSRRKRSDYRTFFTRFVASKALSASCDTFG